MLIEPVYPRAALLAGAGGAATAEFTVDVNGQTAEVNVTESPGPEFAAALTAAIESWVFRAAQGSDGPVPVRLKVTHPFAAAPGTPEARLAELLQPGGAGVGRASGLDHKLAPLWRGFPVYPKALLAAPQAGQATIEFIIDRDGRVRLPSVVSCSAEAFGWAAATAVSQWVFEPPTRGGQAVDITVRIPVDFKPPAP